MLYGNRAGLRCPGCPNNLLQVFHDNRKAQAWLRSPAAARRRADRDRDRTARLALAAGKPGVSDARSRRCWWPGAPRSRRSSGRSSSTCSAIRSARCPATVWFYTTAMVPIAVLYVFVQRRLARGRSRGSSSSWAARAHPSTCARRSRERSATRRSSWRSGSRPRSVTSTATARPVKLPDEDSGRRSTFVERDGQPIAVLLHDPVLEYNAELVRSVCAAASLALENERLQAELRARLVELQASRARLVEATDAERRRIERDLHDGTQQRLVSIAMSLGSARVEAARPRLWPNRSCARRVRRWRWRSRSCAS